MLTPYNFIDTALEYPQSDARAEFDEVGIRILCEVHPQICRIDTLEDVVFAINTLPVFNAEDIDKVTSTLLNKFN